MKTGEEAIVAAVRELGGTVEEIKRHCEFQKGHEKNIFGYCQRQTEFGWNLGSAGGPVIQCENLTRNAGAHMEKGITVLDYTEPKTCEHFIKGGEVIAWKMQLKAAP